MCSAAGLRVRSGRSTVGRYGRNDHFSQNDLIPNRILAFVNQNGPFWPKEVYFGPFKSANRTLATPDGIVK